jgi:hypothetical protein
MLGEKLSPVWSQPVAVESRAGVGGTVAGLAVARVRPDGQTLPVDKTPRHPCGPGGSSTGDSAGAHDPPDAGDTMQIRDLCRPSQSSHHMRMRLW